MEDNKMNNSQSAINNESGNGMEDGQQILSNLERLGYSESSSGQVRLVKALALEKDVIIQSPAERSKLAVLAAWLFSRINKENSGIQGLVVTPSRERAELMAGFLKQLGGIGGINIATFGSNGDIAQVEAASAVVCSPESMGNLIEVLGDSLKSVVLLEADQIPLGPVGEFSAKLKEKGAAPLTAVQSGTLTSDLSRFALESMTYPQTISLNADENTTDAIQHFYFEVGPDLLDKTNALFDLLQVEQPNAAIVFCNARSDVDFVDVVLKKRGARVYKVDDEAQRGSLSFGLRSIKQGEANVLLLNDEGAGDLEVNDFDLVINYSINSEPEVYLHRIARGNTESKLRKVFSLVGPLDYGNFHFIKKVVGLDFAKGELPSAEALSASRMANFVGDAVKGNHLGDSTVASLVEQINAHEHRDQIVALLLHNTINVMPSLRKQAPAPGQGQGRGRDQGEHERRGRDGRGRGDREDRRGGRGGDDRGGRRNDRGGRRRGGRDDGDDNFQRNEGEGDRRYPQMAPPEKEVRVYIGSGSRQGLNQAEFSSLVTKHCGVAEDQIQRFTLRDCYAYADFKEEVAPQVIEKLGDAALPSGEKLFVKKAATLVLPREKEEGESNGPSAAGQEEGFGSSDGGNGEDNGNFEESASS